MAGRSQHPVQIMENQTRFDLNAAIENWRQELAAQPNLASEDRRELETHLRAAIAGFQQRGLNGEESFWLARRRVGQPQQLSEEFVKADPARAWRERVFWMAIAFFIFELWATISGLLSTLFPSFFGRFGAVDQIVWYAVFDALIIWIVISLVLGRITNKSVVWSFLFSSRLLFVVIAAPLFLGFSFLQRYLQYIRLPHAFLQDHKFVSAEWTSFLAYLFQHSLLIVLIVWLIPTQNRKTPKRA